MMTTSHTTKRLIASLSAVAALGATALVGGAGTASASTISNGFVQLCAQGKYSAYAQFPDRGYFSTTVVDPGSCWYGYMGGDSWEPIDVYGVYPGSPKPFSLGTFWYNGSVSGVGIGAEGTEYPGQYYAITW